jgi:hypothetical protein
VQTFLTEANGRAERDAAMLMTEAIPSRKRVTLGGDKNYDTQEFVRELRGMNITPHVAQNDTNRRSAVDERTTRHVGYQVSQRKRKRVEQSFGWMKMVGMSCWIIPFPLARRGSCKNQLCSLPVHRSCLQIARALSPSNKEGDGKKVVLLWTSCWITTHLGRSLPIRP